MGLYLDSRLCLVMQERSFQSKRQLKKKEVLRSLKKYKEA